MEPRFVYITTKDLDEARRIGRELVRERLAACVNIIDGMSSMYWWEDEIQDDQETVLIAKSAEHLMPALIAKVKQLHGYEVPCVVALPVLEENQDYLRWIETETAG